MANDFKIEGLDGVVRRLRTLGPKLAKRALGAAVRKGAAIVRADAQARARAFDRTETPAQVYREIVTRTSSRKFDQFGSVKVQVGVRGGAKRYVDNRKNRSAGRVGQGYEGPGKVFYWRFLEFGTSKMRAQPFMRPALANNVERVTVTIAENVSLQIDKLAKDKT
jgi:HK97 gp10 family phage protein